MRSSLTPLEGNNMATRAKAKTTAKAKRSTKRTRQPKELRIEFPGPPPTAAQRKQIKDIMGLFEVALLALSQGARVTRMCVTKRR
jgi:hypothetical protein